MKTVHIQWRKSSYSTDADGTNCIELASHGSDILIRESDDPDVVITTTPEKLRAFLDGVVAGEFNDMV